LSLEGRFFGSPISPRMLQYFASKIKKEASPHLAFFDKRVGKLIKNRKSYLKLADKKFFADKNLRTFSILSFIFKKSANFVRNFDNSLNKG